MCVKSTSMRECLLTGDIFTGFSFRVIFFQMTSLKTISLIECFLTCYAFKWFTTCMNPMMFFQMTFKRERLFTFIAGMNIFNCPSFVHYSWLVSLFPMGLSFERFHNRHC